MTYLAAVERELERIERADRYRRIEPEAPRVFADFSNNDYLALAADSRMIEALKHVKRVGAGGARLLGGRHREHFLLEKDLAQWVGRERALLFSSGYLAAAGAISVLAGFAGFAYSDALNHACLIDALRATKLERVVYPHREFPSAAQRRGPALVVTESIYGMDGDIADLRAILAELRDDDILLVDDAHALGIAGDEGAGLARELQDDRVVVMGTLGKAIGAAGGFVAGPARLVELLVNSARTFIFDTALPPPIAFAARVGVMLARSADDRRDRLHARVAQLRDGLRELSLPVIEDRTPIVPVVLGSERRTIEVASACLERGVLAPAVRPPTVPAGSSRLRISVRADHTTEHIARLLEVLAACSAIS
ncbi:MAG TPA: aminotransferase class I/II-fold pyridoxal phosphate-dependent enzyme [Candidatus Baltobacteraceae bacterium]|jgi:8-amino-7-oxononanoate synthase